MPEWLALPQDPMLRGAFYLACALAAVTLLLMVQVLGLSERARRQAQQRREPAGHGGEALTHEDDRAVVGGGEGRRGLRGPPELATRQESGAAGQEVVVVNLQTVRRYRAAALTVPIIAVNRISGQYFVFVAEQGPQGTVARQKPITVGEVNGDAASGDELWATLAS